MQILMKRFVFLSLTLLFVVACGQKGPLYLPGDPSSIYSATPPQQQQSTEEEDDEDETPITIQ